MLLLRAKYLGHAVHYYFLSDKCISYFVDNGVFCGFMYVGFQRSEFWGEKLCSLFCDCYIICLLSLFFYVFVYAFLSLFPFVVQTNFHFQWVWKVYRYTSRFCFCSAQLLGDGGLRYGKQRKMFFLGSWRGRKMCLFSAEDLWRGRTFMFSFLAFCVEICQL